MDLWVVAAAAGAGYVAKYWQNLSRDGEGSSEPYTVDASNAQSKPHNFLQQIRDQACPLRRLERKQLGRDFSLDGEDVSDRRFPEVSPLGSDSDAGVASTSGGDGEILANMPLGICGRENIQEIGDGFKEKSEFSKKSGDGFKETDSFHTFARVKSLRSRRPNGYSVKPLKSLENYLKAQLFREHAKMEDYVLSSVPSPSKPRVRPLLVTDGSRVISRASRDFKEEMRFKSAESGTLVGAPRLPKRSVDLLRKPAQSFGNGQSRRWSSSSARISGEPFHSQGSNNGMLLFFLGITIGMMSTIVANKREVDKLHELLKQTEHLVLDLHEEIEMKDTLSVKELTYDGYESHKTKECPFRNEDSTKFSTECELDTSERYGGNEPDNQKKAECFESMSTIEAELEAELERLELNMKSSSIERISDFIELDPNFEADVVQGELRVETVNGKPGDPSDSDHCGSSTNDNNSANYAVSPRELSLRLHEVIQSRLEARIMELERALEDSQKRVHLKESEHAISRMDLYSEVEYSSTQESPTFVDEDIDMDRPMVINLSGEALNAYNEAHEGVFTMTKTEEETPPDTICNGVGKGMRLFNKNAHKGIHGEDNGSISHFDMIHERWSGSLESNEVDESEDEDDDDDEIGELLIKQIVEKARQGSSVVLNAQRMLFSMDEHQ